MSDYTAGLSVTHQIQTIILKNTDRPNTEWFAPPYKKAHTNIIYVSPFLNQNSNIVQSRGKYLQECLLWKGSFNLLKTGLKILTYSMNKEIAIVHSDDWQKSN